MASDAVLNIGTWHAKRHSKQSVSKHALTHLAYSPASSSLLNHLFISASLSTKFLFFSASSKVGEEFAKQFSTHLNVNFQRKIKHFLGIKFTYKTNTDIHVTTHLTSQESDALNLVTKAQLNSSATASKPIPYCSGHPVDTVPDIYLPLAQHQSLNQLLQEYVGSMNWLSNQTRPDLTTITNIIFLYNSNCSPPGHIEAVKSAIRYTKGTTDLSIQFSSRNNAASNPLLNSQSTYQFLLHSPTQIGVHKTSLSLNLTIRQ